MVGEFDRIGYYKNSKGDQIASIPFTDENYEMVLVLPQENTGYWSWFYNSHFTRISRCYL